MKNYHIDEEGNRVEIRKSIFNKYEINTTKKMEEKESVIRL